MEVVLLTGRNVTRTVNYFSQEDLLATGSLSGTSMANFYR